MMPVAQTEGKHTSEMVERVAEAINRQIVAGPSYHWTNKGIREIARAAIAAMREPTRPMVRATFHNEAFVTNWQSAIDEALK